MVEANRCLYCFDAPCATACPTHIDVPRFIKKIATGNLRGSARAILDANILGLSCSRVCPVEVLCEGSCVLNQRGERPIEIGRLQRHAMDHFYVAWRQTAGSRAGDKQGRVACIGGGPASLACAAELRRNGVAVTIFDSRPQPGGLNTYGVAEYKLRPSDSLLEVELVRSMGVEFQTGVEVGSHVPLEEIEQSFDAIFLGVGLGATQSLGVPGENLPGVVDALRFIRDYKTGAAEVGRRVMVVGAGNTAIDAATASVRLGANEVSILYRRSESEMPAFRYEFELAKQDGIDVPLADAAGGDPRREGGRKRGMRAHGVGSARFERPPLPAAGRRIELPAGGRHGDHLARPIAADWLSREMPRRRSLRNQCVAVTRETGQTSNPKYFAGGDCVSGGREVVDAVADGKRAALGILRMLTLAAAGRGDFPAGYDPLSTMPIASL